MTKILVDTDLGGDVDDAIALSLALNSPEIDIVGITTVYSAAEWRAGIIRKMLEAYRRTDIEISLGAEKPLIGRWSEDRITARQSWPEGTIRTAACDYIIDQSEKHDDLCILAIGPLTNVALALAKAPWIAEYTRIVLMGGCITKAQPEWNIKCDPEAARIVFESGIPITMIGLDVTNRCSFNSGHIERIKAANNERTDLLHEMIQKFIRDFKYLPILHDPLALASLIWPDILTFEEKNILIETKGELTRGITVDSSRNGEPNAMAAVSVKPEEFIELLLERIVK